MSLLMSSYLSKGGKEVCSGGQWNIYNNSNEQQITITTHFILNKLI